MIEIMWNTRVVEFVEGADGKLSHLKLEQRDMSGEQPAAGKDGEPVIVGGTPADAGWPWGQSELDVDGVFVAIG